MQGWLIANGREKEARTKADRKASATVAEGLERLGVVAEQFPENAGRQTGPTLKRVGKAGPVREIQSFGNGIHAHLPIKIGRASCRGRGEGRDLAAQGTW